MLYYLSEDPWPLVTVLGLIGLGFLVALWITRQGKQLIRAGIALGLALLVLGVEHLWVTDNERIERVVYDLGQAVEASDADAVVSHLAPDVVFAGETDYVSRRLSSLDSGSIVQAIRSELENCKFERVRISRLNANAGALTRQGTAEFEVFAIGSFKTPFATQNFTTPISGMEWSLGFRETNPGVWKVTRITPISSPVAFSRPPGPRYNRER